MYGLEVLFVVTTVVFLIALNLPGVSRRACLALLVTGLVAAAATFIFGQARVHMLPVSVVFLVCALLLLRRGYSHIAIRVVGVALGLALVAVSVAIALALPVTTLPAPVGPYTVGVTSFTLIDESRNEAAFGAPDTHREIYVQAWYPGERPDPAAVPRARTLWQELYRPPIFKLLFGYMAGIYTHSYEGLPVAAGQGSYPVIVFSPALSGIAEQNTLLMEHLASHGYIVLGITHPYFGMYTTYADGSGVPVSERVMEASSQQGAVDLDAIVARAEQSEDSIESASVWLEYFERGILLNEFMTIWVQDLRLVLDAIAVPGSTAGVPPFIVDRIDTSRIGLLGMSYGGGAVTEVCKVDARCQAAVNLDGGLWGERMRQPLSIPYFVIASPGNAMFFRHDLLTSKAPYYAVTVEGAAHASFTDAAAFVPLFKWLGVTGTIEGERVIEIMNTATRAFFDAHLLGRQQGFSWEGGMDVTVESNQLASAFQPTTGSR